MGIINITPDSFYSKSQTKSIKSALSTAKKMIIEGAEIIDIGGYSSRPGAIDISIQEEINRVVPIIKELNAEFPNQKISIDSFKTAVAEAAILAGANIINDISGGVKNSSIYELANSYKTPYVLMHMKGTPQNMQQFTHYKSLIKEVIYYFSEQIDCANKFGLTDIILDVGIGFSKTTAQNFTLLNNLENFSIFNKPLLLGISRKSLIYKSLNSNPENSLNGTSVLNTIGLLKGASILRVHDVKEAKEAINLINSVTASVNTD